MIKSIKMNSLSKFPRIKHLPIRNEFPLDMTPWEKSISGVEPLEVSLGEQSLGGY
jgi:hypothetical protein